MGVRRTERGVEDGCVEHCWCVEGCAKGGQEEFVSLGGVSEVNLSGGGKAMAAPVVVKVTHRSNMDCTAAMALRLFSSLERGSGAGFGILR